jgi:seryl-tRNA synthetase
MQAFRVREFVRVGTPDVVVDWRDMWLTRGVELLRSLGLAARSDVASDPFFGRGGRMLAANQREQKLKFEVLVPVISETEPTAVCSFNYHQDHFSKIFEIKTSTGELAQTACLGFGLERCVMALFKTHGMVPAEWPSAVREKLFT